MKKICLLIIIILWANSAKSQELIVHHFNSSREEIKTDTLFLGDLVVIAHAAKGKRPHYFQGKITGLMDHRNVIRVFDYARSTRVVPIAGKKINVDEIIGIERLDEKEHKGRQTRAVVATAGQILGNAVGGTEGDIIWGASTAGSIVSDFVSRQQASTERIRCEIVNVEY